MALITTLAQFITRMNENKEYLKKYIPNSGDVWYEPQEKWFCFKTQSALRVGKQKLNKLKSTMVDIPQIMEQYKEYDRLRKKKTRREKQMKSIILTADEEYSLEQMRPSYLKGKRLKNAEHEILKARKRMDDKEDEWRKKVLPKDRNYALCKEELHDGFTFTHQCMFCQDLFTYYPLNHMRNCFRQLHAPPTVLKRYFGERGSYFTRFVDCTDDWKTKLLPKDDDYKLLKPVLIQGHLCYHQCRFCKTVSPSWYGQYPFEHMETCSVRMKSLHQRTGELTSAEVEYVAEKNIMTKEMRDFLSKRNKQMRVSISMVDEADM
mmetsp:Transcript_23928/g.51664  ORF Transcript_23928/g.51664 Transcript_23928/m.51664 type:complete len:320 (-) Transcript_23928:105-1064(-)